MTWQERPVKKNDMQPSADHHAFSMPTNGTIVIGQLRTTRQLRPSLATGWRTGVLDRLRTDTKGKNKKAAAKNKKAAAAQSQKAAVKKATEEVCKESDKEKRIYMNVPSREMKLAEGLGAKVDDLAYTDVWRSKGTCYIPEDVVQSRGIGAFVTEEGEPRWPSWTYDNYSLCEISEVWTRAEEEWEGAPSAGAGTETVYATPYSP